MSALTTGGAHMQKISGILSQHLMITAVSGVPLRERVYLRIVPDKKSGLTKIRFWYDKKLVGIAKVKNEDLNIANF